MNKDISLWLEKLKEKYGNDEDLANNLEGLYHYKGVHYSEYIHMDVLLGIQHTKTDIDDEMIFIIAHQIIELYFKLIVNEINILTSHERKEYLEHNSWMKRLGRVHVYFTKIMGAFEILMPGDEGTDRQMFDTEEFRKFRLSLIPASGFQSLQFRLLELMLTDIHHLLHHSVREEMKNEENFDKLLDNLYWRKGGRHTDRFDDEGGQLKTQTLIDFENRNDSLIKRTALEFKKRNIEYIFFKYTPPNNDEKEKLNSIRSDKNILELMRKLEYHINTEFRRVHFGLAKAHISKINKGTGGTNYHEYLPPQKQQLKFFPELRDVEV